MVTLRKRKSPDTTTQAPPPTKRSSSKAKVPTTAEPKTKKMTDGKETESKVSASAAAPAAGDALDLDTNFPFELILNDGVKTTLKELLGLSVSGIILFTYPKANTPGCTTQACAFRDASTDLSALGYAVYGLSRDSPKANSSFKTKYNLSYNLICDQEGKLIKALGFAKSATQTTRGVFVLTKEGKVLLKFDGGPMATLEAALPAIKEADGASASL